MANRYPSVQSKVLIFIALRNLVSKKMRTFLTVFGIVIGVGAIFFLVSLGVGLQQLVTNQVIGNQSIKSVDISTSNSKVAPLDQETYQKIKNLPNVSRIGTLYSYAGKIASRGGAVDSIVYGVDNGYLKMSKLSLDAGRFIKTSDESAIMINKATMRAIGVKEGDEAIGKIIKLQIQELGKKDKTFTRDFKVVGVSSDEDGNEAYIPGDIMAATGAKSYTQIKLETDDVEDIKGLRSQIQTLGLQTVSPIDTVDQIDEVFKFFNVILAGFGAVGMVVAVLGMFNTLTISLLERTKEIGLMVALGGRDKDMRKLFVYEAVLLSLMGAIIGVIGSVALGQIVNLAMNIFAQQRGVTEGFQMFATPWWLVLGSLIFMVLS